MSFAGKYEYRDQALFILGVKSGFRISELLSLQVKDVMKEGVIFDRVSVQRRNMKKKTEGRTVVLHVLAKEAIEAWIGDLSDIVAVTGDTYLFRSRKGLNRPMSRIRAWQILREAYETNELTGKLSTHSMRKTFADKIFNALDRDIVKTQRALGHKNINSTVSYMSFKQEDIDQAILEL